MSAGKIRGKILSVLWVTGKPLTIERISEEIGVDSSSTIGYVLELRKAKYISAPETDCYLITELGKKAIGIPSVDKNLALKILSPLPFEKAFHFYYDINQYSDIYANSLEDFLDKIQNVDLRSIEFHVPRRDFENWISSLGDLELSKKLGMLRMKQMDGEDLRKRIYEMVKARYEELSQLTLC